MQVSFPIFFPATEEDPAKVAENLNRQNEGGSGGYYAIGANDFWHGGVHYETDEPIRAVGDGSIVAYRLNRDALHCEIDIGETARRRTQGKYVLLDPAEIDGHAWRTEKELAAATPTHAREHYSSGFVLTKHVYETPLGTKVTFHVLAMHLLPFDDYSEERLRDAPSIFHEDGYFVKSANDGKGLAIRDDNGTVLQILPVGAIIDTNVTVNPTDPMPTSPVPITSPVTGYIDVAAGAEVLPFRGCYRVSKAIDAPPASEMGIAVHRSADPKSDVVGIAPKGSPLTFKSKKPDKNKYNELADGGFVLLSDANVELRRRAKPKSFDSVVVCDLPVKRGDILGYAGPYRISPNLVHIEIFVDDVDFLQSCPDKWGPKGYNIPKGTKLRDGPSPTASTLTTKRAIYAEAVSGWTDPNGARWLELPVEGALAWAKAADLDAFGKSLYAWPGWQKIEESGPYSDDGFCDAQELLTKVDKNHDGNVSWKELRDALDDPEIAGQLRRTVCKHPTEWAASADGAKYKRLLGAPWKMRQAEFESTMKHHAALQWWDEAGLKNPKAVWHVHPVEFLSHLRRLVGITAAQLKALMFDCRGSAYKAQGLTARPPLSANDTARLDNMVRDLNETMRDYDIMTDTVSATRVRQCHFIGQMATETRRFELLSEGLATPYLDHHRYYPFHGRGAIQMTWASNYNSWYTDPDNAALFAGLTAADKALLDQLPHFASLQAPLDKSPPKNATPAQEAAFAAHYQKVQDDIARNESKELPGLLDRLLGATSGIPTASDWHSRLRSAGWYWKTHHCNDAADGPVVTPEHVFAVTRIINGGWIGLPERKLYSHCCANFFIAHYKPLFADVPP